MMLPDVNLLVYAVDETSPFHGRARRWWDDVLSSTATVGLCYPSVLGFVRLTTNRRMFDSPLSVVDALDLVQSWLDQSNAMLLAPTERHWPILCELLRSSAAGADLTTDAHIAAYAIEHVGTVYSNDRDFGRFEGLRWKNPLGRGATGEHSPAATAKTDDDGMG
jgi:toxin-antitoxin system PIN domain toxin